MFLAQLCANCSIEVSGRGVILLNRAPTNKVLNATMRGHHLCGMGTAMAIDGQVQAPWTWGRAALMKAAGAAVSWRAAPVVPGPSSSSTLCQMARAISGTRSRPAPGCSTVQSMCCGLYNMRTACALFGDAGGRAHLASLMELSSRIRSDNGGGRCPPGDSAWWRETTRPSRRGRSTVNAEARSTAADRLYDRADRNSAGQWCRAGAYVRGGVASVHFGWGERGDA